MARPRDAARGPTEGEGGETLSFEAMLERLEAVVERLEVGDLPLEDALRAFEEGVSLSRSCSEQLESAERRIEELVRRGSGFVTRPFEPPPDADADADAEGAPDAGGGFALRTEEGE